MRMGWIKDYKVALLSGPAHKAAERGDQMFIAMLKTPSTMPDMSGEIVDWGQMIASVEAEGWVLQHWAVGDRNGHPQAYPVFRRAVSNSL